MKKPANPLLKTISILLALFAGLTHFNPRGGGLHVLLWSPKLAAAALSVVVAIANAFFAGVGLLGNPKSPAASGNA